MSPLDNVVCRWQKQLWPTTFTTFYLQHIYMLTYTHATWLNFSIPNFATFDSPTIDVSPHTLHPLAEIWEARTWLPIQSLVVGGWLRHVWLLGWGTSEVMQGWLMGGVLRSQTSVEGVSIDSWNLASCNLKPLHLFPQCFIQSCRKQKHIYQLLVVLDPIPIKHWRGKDKK